MRGWRIFGLAATAVLSLDQMTKWLVVHVVQLPLRGDLTVISGLFNLRMAWNRGVNFGLFQQGTEAGRWLLIGVSLAVCAWIVWWLRRDAHSRLVMVSGGVLVGGALGNVIDRLVYGAVADFLNVTCCGVYNPYAFNVADAAIFVGAGGLILLAGRENAT